jgi:membrane protease YdiL (CAAX protease family)
MLIPGLVAIIFSIIQYKSIKQVFKCLMTKFSFKSFLFAIGYPAAVIGLCAIIAGLTGLAKLNYDRLHDFFSIRGIITLVITVIINCFLGSLGEELGWRGYLLPLVTESKGKLKATIWVSTIWAFYHIPALFLLAKVTGVGNPFLVAIVQGCVAFMVSFAFSYCFFLSNSLFPVLLLHTMWNYLNTKTLGDIYTNTKGITEGNVFYINGEGVLGLIIVGITSVLFIKQLKSNTNR